MKFRNFVLYMLLFLSSGSAYGQICSVSDPTDTLLNVRSGPNGRIISKIENGADVQIEKTTRDSKNRLWAQVSSSGNSGRVLARMGF